MYGDETQAYLYTNLVTGDETQAILTVYKTPTMLLGMKHKQLLPLIRHPPCYWE